MYCSNRLNLHKDINLYEYMVTSVYSISKSKFSPQILVYLLFSILRDNEATYFVIHLLQWLSGQAAVTESIIFTKMCNKILYISNENY